LAKEWYSLSDLAKIFLGMIANYFCIFLISVFFGGEVSPNFDLKNMISTYRKDFSMEKNGPNTQNFEKKIKIARFL
jgi:uncharacterized membrane protein